MDFSNLSMTRTRDKAKSAEVGLGRCSGVPSCPTWIGHTLISQDSE